MPTAYCSRVSNGYSPLSDAASAGAAVLPTSWIVAVSRNETTEPHVSPITVRAWSASAAHCCADVCAGTLPAANDAQSNGCVASWSVARVNVLSRPAPGTAALNDTVMLPWKPGGSVPYGPSGLNPIRRRLVAV